MTRVPPPSGPVSLHTSKNWSRTDTRKAWPSAANCLDSGESPAASATCTTRMTAVTAPVANASFMSAPNAASRQVSSLELDAAVSSQRSTEASTSEDLECRAEGLARVSLTRFSVCTLLVFFLWCPRNTSLIRCACSFTGMVNSCASSEPGRHPSDVHTMSGSPGGGRGAVVTSTSTVSANCEAAPSIEMACSGATSPATAAVQNDVSTPAVLTQYSEPSFSACCGTWFTGVLRLLAVHDAKSSATAEEGPTAGGDQSGNKVAPLLLTCDSRAATRCTGFSVGRTCFTSVRSTRRPTSFSSGWSSHTATLRRTSGRMVGVLAAAARPLVVATAGAGTSLSLTGWGDDSDTGDNSGATFLVERSIGPWEHAGTRSPRSAATPRKMSPHTLWLVFLMIG